jgi:hypothetical protein
MYLRLWWKDARQFWPIWVFLILAATVTQGLMVHYGGPEMRDVGAWSIVALCWTTLYAFAVSAAAFAGERETGTLRLLDILPASRRVVWASKVSFAFGTTLALAATLLAIAALGGNDQVVLTRGTPAFANGLLAIGSVLLLALILGLFCSSIMSNALLAAVASIVLVTIGWSILAAGLDQYSVFGTNRIGLLVGYLGVVLATLPASYIAFTWSRRNRRVPIRLRIQAPIVVSWGSASRVRQEGGPVRDQSPSTVEAPAPVPIVASTVAARPWSADQRRPRSWLTEMRFLIWETMWEGRRTWSFLLVIGLILPVSLALYEYMRNPRFATSWNGLDLSFAIPWNALVALVAGVSVFGLENRARTSRFLVHHGARPGAVWLAKLVTWCFGLAIIWVPLLIMTSEAQPVIAPPRIRENLIEIALCLPFAFAVGLLCGMVIPRGITAGLVALVIAITVGSAQVALVRGEMLPMWGLAAMPVALLAVTWAWRGDWLLDRPAPGRYVRLGLILTTTFGMLLGGYAGVRAWGIPDPGPIGEPSVWIASASLPPDRNAAELYREAARKFETHRAEFGNTLVDVLGTTESGEQERAQKRIRSEVLALIRQAAARPDCRFVQTERLTLAQGVDMPPMRELVGLVIIDAQDRIGQKDLPGAWDDIVVLIRMARHVSEGATMIQGTALALAIEKEALDLAINWATAPGQTPDRLRAAIAAYRDLPRLIPPAEITRAEAILVERTIDLPKEDLEGLVLESLIGPKALNEGKVPVWAALWLDMITTPWERARARRAIRRFAFAFIQIAALEPWELWPTLGPRDPSFYHLGSSPLARVLVPNMASTLNLEYHNEVARRAIVQVMAIRAWQLKHDGRFPDHLEDIVPDELPSLPVDPYSGQPFVYVLNISAAKAWDLKVLENIPNPPTMGSQAALLYSVGRGQGVKREAITFIISPLSKPASR